MMSCIDKLFIDDPKLELRGKRVVMRVDYNVPLSADASKVVDNQRIAASLPTINYLLSKNVKSIVLLSHLGRPDGQVIPSMSLAPVAKELESLLGKKVEFISERCAESCAEPKMGK